MVVVTCMDGASGSVRERKMRTRKYMSNIVLKQVKENLSDVGYAYKEGKGGIWRYWDRKIKKHILKYNSSSNHLFMVGKSYGGKDSAKILNSLMPKLKYASITLMTVDPDWAFQFNKKLKVPKIDRVVNLYQKGPGLGGVLVKTDSPLEEHEVHNADHFDIITKPIVKAFINDIILRIKGKIK